MPFFIANWDNLISLPKNWVFYIDCMDQTPENAQNCYVRTSSYVNLSVKKSLFDSQYACFLFNFQLITIHQLIIFTKTMIINERN